MKTSELRQALERLQNDPEVVVYVKGLYDNPLPISYIITNCEQSIEEPIQITVENPSLQIDLLNDYESHGLSPYGVSELMERYERLSTQLVNAIGALRRAQHDLEHIVECGKCPECKKMAEYGLKIVDTTLDVINR